MAFKILTTLFLFCSLSTEILAKTSVSLSIEKAVSLYSRPEILKKISRDVINHTDSFDYFNTAAEYCVRFFQDKSPVVQNFSVQCILSLQNAADLKMKIITAMHIGREVYKVCHRLKKYPNEHDIVDEILKVFSPETSGEKSLILQAYIIGKNISRVFIEEESKSHKEKLEKIFELDVFNKALSELPVTKISSDIYEKKKAKSEERKKNREYEIYKYLWMPMEEGLYRVLDEHNAISDNIYIVRKEVENDCIKKVIKGKGADCPAVLTLWSSFNNIFDDIPRSEFDELENRSIDEIKRLFFTQNILNIFLGDGNIVSLADKSRFDQDDPSIYEELMRNLELFHSFVYGSFDNSFLSALNDLEAKYVLEDINVDLNYKKRKQEIVRILNSLDDLTAYLSVDLERMNFNSYAELKNDYNENHCYEKTLKNKYCINYKEYILSIFDVFFNKIKWSVLPQSRLEIIKELLIKQIRYAVDIYFARENKRTAAAEKFSIDNRKLIKDLVLSSKYDLIKKYFKVPEEFVSEHIINEYGLIHGRIEKPEMINEAISNAAEYTGETLTEKDKEYLKTYLTKKYNLQKLYREGDPNVQLLGSFALEHRWLGYEQTDLVVPLWQVHPELPESLPAKVQKRSDGKIIDRFGFELKNFDLNILKKRIEGTERDRRTFPGLPRKGMSFFMELVDLMKVGTGSIADDAFFDQMHVNPCDKNADVLPRDHIKYFVEHLQEEGADFRTDKLDFEYYKEANCNALSFRVLRNEAIAVGMLSEWLNADPLDIAPEQTGDFFQKYHYVGRKRVRMRRLTAIGERFKAEGDLIYEKLLKIKEKGIASSKDEVFKYLMAAPVVAGATVVGGIATLLNGVSIATKIKTVLAVTGVSWGVTEIRQETMKHTGLYNDLSSTERRLLAFTESGSSVLLWGVGLSPGFSLFKQLTIKNITENLIAKYTAKELLGSSKIIWSWALSDIKLFMTVNKTEALSLLKGMTLETVLYTSLFTAKRATERTLINGTDFWYELKRSDISEKDLAKSFLISSFFRMNSAILANHNVAVNNFFSLMGFNFISKAGAHAGLAGYAYGRGDFSKFVEHSSEALENIIYLVPNFLAYKNYEIVPKNSKDMVKPQAPGFLRRKIKSVADYINPKSRKRNFEEFRNKKLEEGVFKEFLQGTPVTPKEPVFNVTTNIKNHKGISIRETEVIRVNEQGQIVLCEYKHAYGAQTRISLIKEHTILNNGKVQTSSYRTLHIKKGNKWIMKYKKIPVGRFADRIFTIKLDRMKAVCRK